jgi:cardiolipin synthase (CMP-forming)
MANALTVLRVLLVPVLVYLLLEGSRRAALWVFFAAGVSDALDGFIARVFNQHTRFGATLDPIADKLLIVATVLTLTWLGLIPLWLTAIIVIRDLVILSGALSYRLLIGTFDMAPTLPGKLCTFAEIVLLVMVLVDIAGYLALGPWLPAAYWIVALISLVSGLHYVWVWSRKAIQASK